MASTPEIEAQLVTFINNDVIDPGSSTQATSVRYYESSDSTLLDVYQVTSVSENLKLYDILIGMGACTNSNYQEQYNLPGSFAPIASYELLQKAVDTAKKANTKVHVGNILSSDIFYDDDRDSWKQWAKMGVLAVEMEAAALYMNAIRAGVNALCILTVSDSLVTHEVTTSQERQNAFTKMVEIALELA